MTKRPLQQTHTQNSIQHAEQQDVTDIQNKLFFFVFRFPLNKKKSTFIINISHFKDFFSK